MNDVPLDLNTIDFVTSDTHFGHTRIIELCDRPFRDLDEMNGELTRRWNSVVGPSDTVLHLGDLALGARESSIGMTAALNGRKLIIPGNHDVFWSHYQSGDDYKQLNLELLQQAGWELLPEEVTGTLDGRELLISHFPYEGDSHGDDRFAQLRPTDAGLPLLHGHTHATDHGARGRVFHVGVDAHGYAPVPMAVIREWLAGVR